ncbi:Response regulator receiver domain-containing protein [Reichenbachiella faecimaris]|uniref:Response regulator receiver domain-containing protein n=1 Tax=Reichenbachiella faecimaris TaxID=692418 RepID=A0A1W2GH60_REIFA|nr:response regulator [Reichenbachiella faecimaris]SMD36003.1 Response regulator receiver domain-containing protein [Reichenbachiella faecimaris]
MKNELPILLVEDDKVDQMTVKRILKQLNADNPITIKQNGLEALEYLNDPANDKPGLILLDLNMPKMNGIEFLKEVKKKLPLKLIPIVVMTTSREEQDRLDSFGHSAAGYMVKPVQYRHFLQVMETVYNYWLLSESAVA